MREEIRKNQEDLWATKQTNAREEAMSTHSRYEEKNQEDIGGDEEKETRDLIERGIDAASDIAEHILDKGTRVFRIKYLREKYGPKVSDFLDEGTPISLNGKHLRGILFTQRKKEKV